PLLDRVLCGAERDWFPAYQDLAGIGLVEPVQDVHERRLARSVLAQERMHLTTREFEADVVVGEDARKLLHDPAHLEDDGGVRHARGCYGAPTDGRNARSGPSARSSLRRYVCQPPGIAVGGLILPLMMSCFRASVFATIDFGTAGLILPRSMPPFERSKYSLPPLPSGWPVCTALMKSNTPMSTRFTPLVITRLASLYWSLSTPMPQMPASSAAFKVPRPQRPATWKSTFAPWAIWFSATALQRSDFTKSCE